MANREEGVGEVDIERMDNSTTGRATDQRQQRPQQWGTGSPADAGKVGGQQGKGQRCKPVCMPHTGGYARRMERQWRTSGSKSGVGV